MKQSFEAGKSVTAGKMYFLSGVFYGAERKVYLPMAKCLTRHIRRRCVDKLRNQFAAGKLGQAANPVVSFKHNKRSLPLPLSPTILNLYFAFKAQTCAAGQVNGIAGVFDGQNAAAHFYGDVFAQTAVSV